MLNKKNIAPVSLLSWHTTYIDPTRNHQVSYHYFPDAPRISILHAIIKFRIITFLTHHVYRSYKQSSSIVSLLSWRTTYIDPTSNHQVSYHYFPDAPRISILQAIIKYRNITFLTHHVYRSYKQSSSIVSLLSWRTAYIDPTRDHQVSYHYFPDAPRISILQAIIKFRIQTARKSLNMRVLLCAWSRGIS